MKPKLAGSKCHDKNAVNQQFLNFSQSHLSPHPSCPPHSQVGLDRGRGPRLGMDLGPGVEPQLVLGPGPRAEPEPRLEQSWGWSGAGWHSHTSHMGWPRPECSSASLFGDLCCSQGVHHKKQEVGSKSTILLFLLHCEVDTTASMTTVKKWVRILVPT